jgi:hypothetical protein
MNPSKQSGIAPIVVVLIIVGLLVIAGGIYYFVSQKTPQPAQPISPAQPEEKPKISNSTNISQLTKEQVLNGFDPCGQQFKNGEINNGWEKYLQLEKTCDQAQAMISLVGDNIVFADLDNDGVMEAVVPARVVRASSGGVLYVFKNDGGVARVVDTVDFGKSNGKIVTVNGNIVLVEIDKAPYGKYQKTYKFVNGKLVEQ